MSLNATAKYIRNTFNSYALTQMVDLNWDVEDYPELEYRPLTKNEALIDTLKGLVEGKIVAPDDALEDWAREMLNLPEREEQVERQQNQGATAGERDNKTQVFTGKKGCPHTLKEKYKARTYQEGDRVWRRDLTAFERRVNLERVEEEWDSAEEDFLEKGEEITRKQLEDLFKRAQKKVEEGRVDEIPKIPVRYQGEFTEFLGDQQRDLVDFGKQEAAEELGAVAGDVATSIEERRKINAKSGVVANNIAQRVKTSFVLGVINHLDAGETEKEALFNARQEAEDRAETELQGTSSATVGDAVNDGREAVAEHEGAELAQYSAILDDSVCELCEWLDGMIIEVANPDYDRFDPQLHRHCRCLWVYIRPDEEPQPDPDWETPPDNLVGQYGTFIN